ncbi:THO complex subunit 2 [Serendipita indica DSM 11827]|nr:THO complex subunit 2 [Serendipita indica DSM 11827]
MPGEEKVKVQANNLALASMAVAVANATKELLNRWNNDGRSQCLQQLKELCTQPERIDDLRVAFQILVNSLVNKDGFRLLPDDFGPFYRELAQAQPTSSRPDENPAISQILVDAISVVDDTLDDLAQAQETEKERQENRNKHRQIPERQPLVKLLRYLLSTGAISHQLLALNLEYSLLQDVGLLGNALQTAKQEVRARTRLIQTKVNLLREQSEGYSKFTVELCTSLGPPHDPQLRPDEVALKAQTKSILERLMRVAGYFDLDPTRMLDLILDVFSTHVMTHSDLFLYIIREFSGTRTRLLGSTSDIDSSMDTSESSESALERRLQEAEGPLTNPPTLPQLKNPLAQLLGFKFSHYAADEQSVPRELMFVTALLIREGHLSIADIYNHLSPDEAGMKALAEKQDAEMKKRIRIVKTTAADKDNALANAGVLSNLDDRDYLSRRQPQVSNPAPVSTTKAVKEVKVPEEITQHRDLAIALLSIGALRPAVAILTNHPWLTSRYPQIADILLKHLEYSIDPMYRSFSPATTHPEAAATYALPLNSINGGQNRKTKLTMTFPDPPPTPDTQQIFFYPRWTERVPLSTAQSDLEVFVEPMLRIIGVHAYRSIPLFVKLCRIAREQLKNEGGPPTEDDFWTYVLRRHFLPLVSMAKDNPMLGNEIWPILQRLEIQQRWAIYAEWFQRTYDGSLEMRLKKAYVTRETKGVLRRLSSKNQGQSARALAKIAHHNPCVLFQIAIDQVMSYDNLADPLIEAFRTLSPIGYDILTYSLLDAFSQTERPRMKDDGTNVSHWLQSLASLTAHLCRRYNAMDPTPILQFIVHRLQAESPIDSIILRELISKMGNIEPPQLLAENQIAAMGGGPVLQIATVALESRGIGQTRAMLKSSDKLLSAMAKRELILPILLLLAQQSQSSVFKMDSSEAGLKGIGAMFDDLRGDFFQFVSFLSPVSLSQKSSANESRDAFFKSLPSVATLVNDYGIEATTVMFICRAAIQRTIVEQVMASSTERKSKPSVSKEETIHEPDPLSQTEASIKTETVEGDVVMQVDTKETADLWLPVLQPWISSVAEILPPRVHEVMGAAFFVTFWQLSQFEITPLVSHYKEQRNKLSKMVEEHARRDPGKEGSTRERMNWLDKKERIEAFRDNLVRESNEHLEVYAATKKRLSQERKHWFVNNKRGKLELLDYIVQYCIFPRSLLSPIDAEFSATFIKLLHNLGTVGFWTLGCYRKCVGEQLRGIIFSCTQNEARNFGRFLRVVFSDLGMWFKDEKAFVADSKKGDANSPGFSAKASAVEVLSWAEFKRFLKKLHMQLGSVIVACITMTNREFMHVSNAILVLKELLPVFPTNAVHSSVAWRHQSTGKLLSGQLRRIKSRWETPEASSATDSKSSQQVNTSASQTSEAKNPSSTSQSDARDSTTQNAPITHPLPANPMAQASDQPSTEIKLPKRPDIVKRINREEGHSTADESQSTAATDAVDKPASAIRVSESTDPMPRGSPRPPNGPVGPGHRDIPSGPRGTRGHRLTEDPSSRPPPAASMAPPRVPSHTHSSQEARTSALQQADRGRNQSDGDKELGPSDRRPPVDSRRPDAPSREGTRRRSPSPGRSGADDARRREDERRKDEKRSDRDRRSDREHRERRESARIPRSDEASSPHREESRKRTRDAGEKDPSDRDSKRTNRERERRERHRDERDDRRHDKDKHRDKDRGRESKHKHGSSSTGASPNDPEREAARSSAPSAPRAGLISEEAKRSILNATAEPPRRDRDREKTDSYNRPLGGLSSIGSSRGPGHSQRREERGQDNLQPPSLSRSLVSRIESPRVDSSAPNRPSGDYSRDGGHISDRENGRKRGPIEDNSGGPAKRPRRDGP